MSIARVTEITAASNKSFEDAVEQGLNRASKTLDDIQGAWVGDLKVVVQNNKITEWRVNMKVTFILKE